jgi:HEAT repeat protein
LMSAPRGGLLRADAEFCRADLIDLLMEELNTQRGWSAIHAGDALIEQGEIAAVTSWLTQPVFSSESFPRVGLLRLQAACLHARAEAIESLCRILIGPVAEDRLVAVETLAKLAVDLSPPTIAAIRLWLANSDEATRPFLHWSLMASPSISLPSEHEAALVKLLESDDPIARLRAAYVFGRQTEPGVPAIASLNARLATEPLDSPARVYLLCAALSHDASHAGRQELKRRLHHYLLHGSSNEQHEAAKALGRHGDQQDAIWLRPLLGSPHALARIGAASSLLNLNL